MTAVPLSALRRHRLLILLGLVLMTLAVMMASVAIGAMQISPAGVWRALTHPTGTAFETT